MGQEGSETDNRVSDYRLIEEGVDLGGVIGTVSNCQDGCGILTVAVIQNIEGPECAVGSGSLVELIVSEEGSVSEVVVVGQSRIGSEVILNGVSLIDLVVLAEGRYEIGFFLNS